LGWVIVATGDGRQGAVHGDVLTEVACGGG
jgi:hypothetical protein